MTGQEIILNYIKTFNLQEMSTLTVQDTIREWAIRFYNIYHTPDYYSREFRRIRSKKDHGYTFKEIVKEGSKLKWFLIMR